MPRNIEQREDTSLLLDQLLRQFRKDKGPVEVDFRQMIGWVRLGDQFTHQIHPYPGKLLPHISHFFVRAQSLLHDKKKMVLDPFCGSGTVALEASLAGSAPLIADSNPFALLVAQVKTTPYVVAELEQRLSDICARATRYRYAEHVPIVNENLWYLPEKKKALELLRRAVISIEELSLRDFFLICFSVVARRLSFADPAVSVPVRLRTKSGFCTDTNKKVTSRLSWIAEANTLDEFVRVAKANIARVQATNATLPKRKVARTVGHDARSLREIANGRMRLLPGGSVPLVITSPPYGAAQKYVRATSLTLNWLGLAAPSELSNLEGASIGREHLPAYRNDRPPDGWRPEGLGSIIEKVEAINPLRAAITRQYLFEMRQAVQEMSRVTLKGGHVIIVIGNNQVCGKVLRNDQYLVNAFHECGFELRLSLLDDIKSRGLMTKRNRTASVISRESVLMFRKN